MLQVSSSVLLRSVALVAWIRSEINANSVLYFLHILSVCTATTPLALCCLLYSLAYYLRGKFIFNTFTQSTSSTDPALCYTHFPYLLHFALFALCITFQRTPAVIAAAPPPLRRRSAALHHNNKVIFNVTHQVLLASSRLLDAVPV